MRVVHKALGWMDRYPEIFVAVITTAMGLFIGRYMIPYTPASAAVYVFPNHYRVRVGPGFTDEQYDAVQSAADNWVDAVGDKNKLSISVDSGPCPTQPNVVDACFIPNKEQLVPCLAGRTDTIGCTKPGDNYVIVTITLAYDSNTFFHLAQHELGHVLGILDSNERGAVMFAYVDAASKADDVSSIDVGYFLNRKPQ